MALNKLKFKKKKKIHLRLLLSGILFCFCVVKFFTNAIALKLNRTNFPLIFGNTDKNFKLTKRNIKNVNEEKANGKIENSSLLFHALPTSSLIFSKFFPAFVKNNISYFIKNNSVQGKNEERKNKIFAEKQHVNFYEDEKYYDKIKVGDLLTANPFSLPKLPWSPSSLSPYISEKTVENHYGKHHATYCNNLNSFVSGDASLKGKSLQEIIRTSHGPVFNNAAQYYNHNICWLSIHPNGGRVPHGKILLKIEKKFENFKSFREKFINLAKAHFGSGWIWLVLNKNTNDVEIAEYHNAQTPLQHTHLIPIITLDVWEHAYYLDYQVARIKYIEGWFDNLINWDFANAQVEEHLKNEF